MTMKLGVYIHIPFCQRKCLYCDFPSFSGMENYFAEYTNALCREIALRGVSCRNYEIDTVYIGGGTPTVLPKEFIPRILQTLRECFSIDSHAEITVEANPGTLKEDILSMLTTGGINRISLGVQTFDDELLKKLGRIHTAKTALEAVEMAKHFCGNVSMDLMYGLPNQQFSQLRQDLFTAVELGVQHISVYGLKIEEGTPFFNMNTNHELSLPSEDEEDAMYEHINSFLPAKNYKRYEISNYAKPGFASQHNLKYWHYDDYLGIGAAAHSFLHGRRSANTKKIDDYIKHCITGRLPVAWTEEADEKTAMAEFAFLALRTTQGISYKDFKHYFNSSFVSIYGNTINELLKQGLITHTSEGICLTDRGMKLGNIVFAAFLP